MAKSCLSDCVRSVNKVFEPVLPDVVEAPVISSPEQFRSVDLPGHLLEVVKGDCLVHGQLDYPLSQLQKSFVFLRVSNPLLHQPYRNVQGTNQRSDFIGSFPVVSDDKMADFLLAPTWVHVQLFEALNW